LRSTDGGTVGRALKEGPAGETGLPAGETFTEGLPVGDGEGLKD